MCRKQGRESFRALRQHLAFVKSGGCSSCAGSCERFSCRSAFQGRAGSQSLFSATELALNDTRPRETVPPSCGALNDNPLDQVDATVAATLTNIDNEIDDAEHAIIEVSSRSGGHSASFSPSYPRSYSPHHAHTPTFASAIGTFTSGSISLQRHRPHRPHWLALLRLS